MLSGFFFSASLGDVPRVASVITERLREYGKTEFINSSMWVLKVKFHSDCAASTYAPNTYIKHYLLADESCLYRYDCGPQ